MTATRLGPTLLVDFEPPDPQPARRILHCDMDCFYAAVHMRDEPRLRGRPVIIGGRPEARGVVAAASYEARRFGVHSAMSSALAARLCPEAVFLRPEFSRYQSESAQAFEIFRSFSPIVQPVSIDEAYLDVSDHLGGFGSATAIATEIKRRILVERGLTVSVGVGPNRLVAKIASDLEKPDGLVVVKPGQVDSFLRLMPARRLPGIGPATEKVLRDDLQVVTVDDLRRVHPARLIERFGRFGEAMHRYAYGVDSRPVVVEFQRQSLSSERTYLEDLIALEKMDDEIGRLATDVADGLARRELASRTITLKVRYADFVTATRSRTFTRPLQRAEEIGAVGRDLLRRTAAGEQAVRLLGVGAAKLMALEAAEMLQLELFAQSMEDA